MRRPRRRTRARTAAALTPRRRPRRERREHGQRKRAEQLKLRVENAARFKKHWGDVRSAWRDEVEFRKAAEAYARAFVADNDLDL